MVLNDTKADIVYAKVQSGLSWGDVARKMGTCHHASAIDAASRGNLPDAYVRLAAALGYDIIIQLVPHEGETNE